MGEKTVVDRLNELLEAERSGVIVYEQMSFLSSSRGANKLFATIRNNEATDCEMLHSLISQRKIRPTDNMNDFANKVGELDDERERIEMCIRGCAWIVRKIAEFSEAELTEAEQAFLLGMRNQHMWNIGTMREILKPEGQR